MSSFRLSVLSSKMSLLISQIFSKITQLFLIYSLNLAISWISFNFECLNKMYVPYTSI